MKPAALGSVCVAVWGFWAAACVSGCATGEGSGPGSDAPTSSDDGGGDATARPGSDGGSSRDSGTIANADARTDAAPGADSGGDVEGQSDAEADVAVVADSGTDAGVGADASTDAPAGRDSGAHDASADAADASEAGGPDASAIAGFGTTCPAGTVYSDPFTTDPLASGHWTPLIGPITYDSTHHLVQLAEGTPNTQVWIGTRPTWTNYTVSVQVRLDSATIDAGVIGNGGINFRIVDPGPTNPPNDSGMMYFAGINASQVLLGIENGGAWTPLAVLPATFTLGTFYTLTVNAKGSTLSVALDGTTYVTVVDTTFSTGGIGLRTYGAGASYGAVTVTCNP
jgi:hypothetical protein